MPSFLNSAELKRLDASGAEIVGRASHSLFLERYISKFLTLSAHRTPFINLKCLMYISILMRLTAVREGKPIYHGSWKALNGYVPESIRAVYSRCQINRPLYFSMKQDNLITLDVGRFPNLFDNLSWFIFARLIFLILTFIYICWYLYLLDTYNQENLYILTPGVSSNKRLKALREESDP